MAVFAWGLAYKLSLYDPPQAVSRQMPQAKLLSRDEQPTVSTAASIAPDSPAPEIHPVPALPLSLLLACVSLLAGLAFSLRLPFLEARSSRKPVLAQSKLFFRPPPSCA